MSLCKVFYSKQIISGSTKANTTAYKKYSQLAQWNNEGETINEMFKTNFGKTNKFVMVKALGDTMVFPKRRVVWTL